VLKLYGQYRSRAFPGTDALAAELQALRDALEND
jgi:hypothetical protein